MLLFETTRSPTLISEVEFVPSDTQSLTVSLPGLLAVLVMAKLRFVIWEMDEQIKPTYGSNIGLASEAIHVFTDQALCKLHHACN